MPCPTKFTNQISPGALFGIHQQAFADFHALADELSISLTRPPPTLIVPIEAPTFRESLGSLPVIGDPRASAAESGRHAVVPEVTARHQPRHLSPQSYVGNGFTIHG